MSFFNWFGKKAPTQDSAPAQHSGLGQTDATVPLDHSQPQLVPPSKGSEAGGRRSDRLERRELLYGVVRECMTGAGMLSSSYKFKVLSLDPSGRQYLIMMDLPLVALSDPTRFAEIEGVIARSAKERFNILVSAVYWRVNDLVTAGQHAALSTAALYQDPLPASAGAAAATATAAAAAETAAVNDLLLAEEMLAFKLAMSNANASTTTARAGEFFRSVRRNPEPMPDFSDTEPYEPPPALGPTQFGGLS